MRCVPRVASKLLLPLSRGDSSRALQPLGRHVTRGWGRGRGCAAAPTCLRRAALPSPAYLRPQTAVSGEREQQDKLEKRE
eukprot:3132498-Pleurochrysis_carterae.AAC.1